MHQKKKRGPGGVSHSLSVTKFTTHSSVIVVVCISYCGGLKRVNKAEPQLVSFWYWGLVDILQGCPIQTNSSRSDKTTWGRQAQAPVKGALRNVNPKSQDSRTPTFVFLTFMFWLTSAPPILARPHHPTLISRGIVLGMLMESYASISLGLGWWWGSPEKPQTYYYRTFTK